MTRWTIVLAASTMTIAIAVPGGTQTPSPGAQSVGRYDVVWRTPSDDAFGSMPLGNGDVGVNVWVQGDGALLFYIGKTDAWSGNARLLKLGRVRVTLDPNPFADGTAFAQTLRLEDGAIEIRAGESGSAVRLRLWVDADHPVIHLEGAGAQPFTARVSLELWRMAERPFRGRELYGAYGLHRPAPDGGIEAGSIPAIIHPDTILPSPDDRIVWCHRNATSIWPATMKLQGLSDFVPRATDPLLNRTFGGAITGDGLRRVSPTTLVSERPSEWFSMAVTVLTRQTPTIDAWTDALYDVIRAAQTVSADAAWQTHRQWWQDFWDRSWIRVSGTAEAETVTEGYVLQRFMNAIGGRGAYPIKFNGSIFTVDAVDRGERYDADYRRWGGPYWFQNTRLVYWPMLASGDFDLMRSFFAMYRDDLPLTTYRTRRYFGHGGAFFPETMYFWGAYANTNYGWDRDGRPVGWVENTYIRYYWQGGLELMAMMLDYYSATGSHAFATDTLLPLADATMRFYAEHYRRDPEGRLIIDPAQALETWQDVVNPLPEIAGLCYDLPRLLELPDDLVAGSQRAAWRALLSAVPPIPVKAENGDTVLAAAQEIRGRPRNSENPELYAVFPYPLYAVGRPDIEMARATFAQRRIRGTGCWRQDAIQAAFLGLTDVAREYVVRNFSTHDSASRFPAFWFGQPDENWTPDWIPDEDHGGVSMLALQSMLMQEREGEILLFPAWPKEWNVEFKLHAARQTTVEGVYRDGQLRSLTVTPVERRADIDAQLRR